MNLLKLTPAPWRVEEGWSDIVGQVWQVYGPSGPVGKFLFQDDAEQCCLARNAMDVMMRRKHTFRLVEDYGSWGVMTSHGLIAGKSPDPFTALVTADKWFKENVDKEGK